jgi:hypothetical protein
VKNIVTQSALISILHNVLPKLSRSFLSRTVRDFETFKKPKEMNIVHDVAKAIEAFRFLFFQRVSAVPIVDKNKKLVASVKYTEFE